MRKNTSSNGNGLSLIITPWLLGTLAKSMGHQLLQIVERTYVQPKYKFVLWLRVRSHGEYCTQPLADWADKLKLLIHPGKFGSQSSTSLSNNDL